jgi:DNA polymerase-1
MTTRQPSGRGAPVLCLIDGTALAYRSYYAFVRRPLVDSDGKNVSAVFGFADKLLALLEELSPDYIAVAFDTPEPTFRHEAYEEYKATREEPPDDMIPQFPVIEELVGVFGVSALKIPGYEADDVIGTLAVRGRREGARVVIVAGDKDFFQLVGDGIVVFDPYKKIEYTEGVVEEVFGVAPSRVIEVLGLAGDASDNVPGVPGIGKKTAVDLIGRFGTIEGVIAHVDEVSGTKRKESLREHADDAFASRRLVTIETDAPVEVSLADLRRRDLDVGAATAFLRDHEFPSLLARVVPLRSTASGAAYELVTTKKALTALLAELRASGGFVIDLETTSLDPYAAEIVGIALARDEERAFYVPVGHWTGKGLTREHVLGEIGPLLTDPNLPKYGQNLKYDYQVLSLAGIEMTPLAFDTMIASYLVDPARRQHGLAALALEHLDRRVTPISSLIGKGSDQISFAEVDPAAARDYACEDAEVTLLLTGVLRRAVAAAGLDGLLRDVEMPLVRVLARMELRGVALDTRVLESLGERLGAEADTLRAKVCELSGVEFNLDSPKQVGEVLFERLELPRGRRTKTGYSTDIDVLERLRDAHEVPGLILEYRQLAKLKAGYLDALPRLVNPRTGRVHTSFNQTVTSTGRLSSSNPNLQNIPVRTELGREIRKAFVAEEGNVLLSADYSQIELRIMAHLSGDEGLRAAFRARKDLHTSTAALIFGHDEGGVTPEERAAAKTINFGVMYGMSPYGLARQLGISNAEAGAFIDTYFANYPGVLEYTERAIAEAEESGYAVTMLGRRRPIRGLSSDNASVRGLAERVAVNTPIQGSAADLIKLAMIAIERRVTEAGIPCDMVLQVHDELVFEVLEAAVGEAEEIVREEMERPEGFEMDVPITVNTAHGLSWFEAH